MRRRVPEWMIQLAWFLGGICATGAVWYFLSQNRWAATMWTVGGAILFAALAIWLHRRNDAELESERTKDVLVHVGEEKVTCTELLRSLAHDVVIIHGHDHMLGVSAEYRWIAKEYPDAETESQSLTTLELITGKGPHHPDQRHFDVIHIKLPDGRKKEVYFDISSFFGGGSSSVLDPDALIAKKLSELYK